MNGDQSRPTEFGTANRQDGIFEVHVTEFEVQRFADAQAGDAEQADEAMEYPTQGRSGVDGQATGSSNAASSKRCTSASVYR